MTQVPVGTQPDVTPPTGAEQPTIPVLAEDLAQVVPEVVRETRAGYKTTEFWLTVATAVLVNINVIPLPEKFQGAVTAAMVAIYAVARGIAKKGVPDITPVEPAA